MEPRPHYRGVITPSKPGKLAKKTSILKRIAFKFRQKDDSIEVRWHSPDSMAEVSTVPVNNFNVQLFNELKHRFPEVPDNVVTDVMREHLSVRERCIEALGRESNKYLYGDFTSGGLPVEANHQSNHMHPMVQPSLSQLQTKISKIHISTAQTGTDRQRSHSGGSSGSHDFRQRSDSSESRTSRSSIGSNHSAGPAFTKVGTPGTPTTPGETELPAGSSQQYMRHASSTPHFTSVHQAYVDPGSQTAPIVQQQNYDPFITNSQTVQTGGLSSQYPPQHGIYTPTTTHLGSNQSMQRTTSAPGQVPSHMTGTSYGPYETSPGIANYNPIQSYSIASQPPGAPQPVYSSTGYPLQQQQQQQPQQQQQQQSGPAAGQFMHTAWNYTSPSVSSQSQNQATPASRPAQFTQNFPTGNYTLGTNTPSPQHHYPPSQTNFSSPQRDVQPNNPHTYTPPRPSVQTARPHGDSPVNSRPGIYPPVSSPSHATQGSFMSQFQIMLGPRSVRTPSPGNPPGGFYLPAHPGPTTPGSGSESGTPTQGYPQQVYYPGYHQWTASSSASGTPLQNPLMSPSPDMARIMQQPMQPILSPASSHSSLSGADTPQSAGPMLPGDGRNSRSGSIPGTEDIAYTQALILHQRARLDKLLKDLEEAHKKLALSRSDIQDREKRFIEWRKQKASSFPSALDVQRMREENRRLQIDIQLMTREIDMVNNGQTPLGVVDPGELQSFYNNIGTGQRGSIHASPPTSGSETVTTSLSTTSSPSTTISSRHPPPRPPPPHQPLTSQSTSPSTHPPAPPHLVGLPYPPVSIPIPREQPPPYSEQAPEPDEGENWSCSACSFLNHPALDHCELCEMPRINIGTNSHYPYAHHHSIDGQGYSMDRYH